MSSSEISRRLKVVDMMISMHAILRDRFYSRARNLDIATVVVSVILCATVFLDPVLVGWMGLKDTEVRFALGLASVLVAVMSIISLLVKWERVGAAHDVAAAALSDLKAQGRRASAKDDLSADVLSFMSNYDLITAKLTPVPDSQFPALKAYHYRKIALSKLIDMYPNIPVPFLRLLAIWKDSRSAWSGETGPIDENN
jgi:hypothetical protein